MSNVSYFDVRISSLHEEMARFQRELSGDKGALSRLVDSYGLALQVALEAKQAFLALRDH